MPAFQHTLHVLRLPASTVYNETSNGTADHAGDYHATTTTLFPYLLSALGFVGFMLCRQMFMQPLMQCLMKPIRGCTSKLGRVCSRGALLLKEKFGADSRIGRALEWLGGKEPKPDHFVELFVCSPDSSLVFSGFVGLVTGGGGGGGRGKGKGGSGGGGGSKTTLAKLAQLAAAQLAPPPPAEMQLFVAPWPPGNPPLLIPLHPEVEGGGNDDEEAAINAAALFTSHAHRVLVARGDGVRARPGASGGDPPPFATSGGKGKGQGQGGPPTQAATAEEGSGSAWGRGAGGRGGRGKGGAAWGEKGKAEGGWHGRGGDDRRGWGGSGRGWGGRGRGMGAEPPAAAAEAPAVELVPSAAEETELGAEEAERQRLVQAAGSSA